MSVYLYMLRSLHHSHVGLIHGGVLEARGLHLRRYFVWFCRHAPFGCSTYGISHALLSVNDCSLMRRLLLECCFPLSRLNPRLAFNRGRDA